MWKRFTAIGDSFTEGKGDDVGELQCISWVEHFAERMRHEEPAFKSVNLAQGGLITREIMEQQLERALSLKPDLVSIITGGNDIMKGVWNEGEFRKLLGDMLSAIRSQGAVIIVGNIADFALTIPVLKMPKKIELQRLIRDANSVIAELARQHNAVHLDFWSRPDSRDLAHFSADFIHPNAAGYVNIAEYVYRELFRQTGAPSPQAGMKAEGGSLS
ncbi:SGNH/GDSL hydrolase family protein [Paenibacillus oenotherae]|uniref:SGNH/GDSL hydrolase family protein n=1 Tax=Paenibacillus oenotherae TaxID=1435645 RepID=A0ABS7DBR4_9BACL|nr:SGNH/GDSL hydrolase family protein [Paenibacillus oenotherae]